MNETATARDLRRQLREDAAREARLQLLTRLGGLLATRGPDSAPYAEALSELRRFLAVASGALLAYREGTLEVLASQGELAPAGSRLPVRGALAAALRKPYHRVLRHEAYSQLRVPAGATALEWVEPLCLGGECQGLWVLLDAQRPLQPEADDEPTLQAAAALLAGLLRAPAVTAAADPGWTALLEQLTPREREVLHCLPQGLSNAEMGAQLGIAAGTVKIHVERVLHKLGVKDRTQAAVLAVRGGWTP